MSGKLAAYPWGSMPLRKCIEEDIGSFPLLLQQVMTPFMDLEKKNATDYRYVSCESKGIGMQVQWYCRDSKCLKRLAKVTHAEVGALARTAALLDSRVCLDNDPSEHLYTSTMRWLDWLLASDVCGPDRTSASEARAYTWVTEVHGALQLMTMSKNA